MSTGLCMSQGKRRTSRKANGGAPPAIGKSTEHGDTGFFAEGEKTGVSVWVRNAILCR